MSGGVAMRISRWGKSLAARIPQSLAAGAALGEGFAVDMVVEDGRLVIKKKVLSLDEFVAGISDDNRHAETEWGAPRGGEAW